MSAEDIAKTINENISEHRPGAVWTICPVCFHEVPSLLVANCFDRTTKVKCVEGCHRLEVIGALKGSNLWEIFGKHIKVV